ncbi:MAG TPA: mechanosensitive ion channel domain-containing protein [Anaerolineales bacterium]|nr:mechanosensitive ion channel domain-containing protein [Anaerolineales bacterium]
MDLLFDPFVGRLITLVIGFLFIGLLARWLQHWLTRYSLDKRTASSVSQGIRFLSYLAAVTLVLIIFSGQLPGLTVTLGVAGAGIAFALQEVIVSLAGWIAISFGQFYAIGDRVQLGGIRGDVIQIGVLRTTLMEIGEWVKADQYNGRIVRISNAFVFKEPVFNYTEEISFVWDEISIPVRYGSDHQLAREIMRKAADAVLGASIENVTREWDVMRRKYPLEHASVEPRVFLIANDNWMQITLRYPVDVKHRRSVHDELFMYILDAIAETEKRVMLASATLELVAAPALDVRLQSAV